MRTAVIGIGSNSLRMLLADVSRQELRRIKRYREGMRIFAALDENGNISEEMIARACESVACFSREAQNSGAQNVHLFATSAVRDAKNQAAFASALESATGLTLEICSGETEARLSYIGATDGKPSGLIDIGGGSTEIACGDGAAIDKAVSLQMGAVRLYRMKPITDVASAFEVVQLAREILAPCREAFAGARGNWVGVGGTFTAAAALIKNVPWDERATIHGFCLTRDAVEGAMRALAPLTVQQRLQIASLQPQRADIVVHGVAILLAAMHSLAIPSIRVSECGNLEGFLKEKYHCRE